MKSSNLPKRSYNCCCSEYFFKHANLNTSAEDSCLLGSDVVSVGDWLPAFQRIVSLNFKGYHPTEMSLLGIRKMEVTHTIIQNADWEPFKHNSAFLFKSNQPTKNHHLGLITLKYKATHQEPFAQQRSVTSHRTWILSNNIVRNSFWQNTSLASTGNKMSISNDQMFTRIMNTSSMYFIWIYAAGRCIRMMN